MDVVGSDRHRADRLFVTFVPDVDDLVALLGARLHFVMDLGDEDNCVDDIATLGPSSRHDFGAEPWAESMIGRPAGTAAMSSTKITPDSSNRFTTSWLCTISW